MEMNEGIETLNAGGLVRKAAIIGSANPVLYMRRFQRDHRREGGYRLQMSPHDISSLINYARPYLKTKRMLCLGVATFGAEKFIAEELGMVDVHVYPKDKPTGTYDLITLFGDNDFNLDGIFAFTHINSLIACLNTHRDAQMPGLRQTWMDLRRIHFPILQTVDRYDMGVGMVKVTYKEDKHGNEKPLCTKRSDGAISEPGSQSQAEQPVKPADSEGLGIGGKENGHDGQRDEAEAVSGTPEEAPVQEGRPEDLQAEEVAAPYGRKLNGEPKKRPGRVAV